MRFSGVFVSIKVSVWYPCIRHCEVRNFPVDLIFCRAMDIENIWDKGRDPCQCSKYGISSHIGDRSCSNVQLWLHHHPCSKMKRPEKADIHQDHDKWKATLTTWSDYLFFLLNISNPVTGDLANGRKGLTFEKCSIISIESANNRFFKISSPTIRFWFSESKI